MESSANECNFAMREMDIVRDPKVVGVIYYTKAMINCKLLSGITDEAMKSRPSSMH